MAVIKKLLVVCTLLVLCSLLFFGGTTRIASAATHTPQRAAATCYGSGAHSFSFSTDGNITIILPTNGSYYTTTSYCNDINMKFTSFGGSIAVCVIFIRHTGDCNYWTNFYNAGSWATIATNVADGTAFVVRVELGVGNYTGLVAA